MPETPTNLEQKFNRTSKFLLWMVATCLPIAGLIGFTGYALFHSLLAFWTIFDTYVLAFLVLGAKGYREYRRWQQSSSAPKSLRKNSTFQND